jgi:fumarylacetoacetase
MSDGFGPDHLPYGIFRAEGKEPRIGARLGDQVLDVRKLVDAPDGTLDGPTLNAFLRAGRDVWTSVREQLRKLVDEDGHERGQYPLDEVELLNPLDPPDYVDFYSSIEHATNLGRMFRPDSDPLLPNWRWLPVGYHGRSASVVGSGTPVRRPRGQMPPGGEGESPSFGPSRALDFELELGFVTGDGPQLGTPMPIDEWSDRVFGVTLVNDWSARDLQRWEYQPLGPFLSKSFATSVGLWITPLEAIEGGRVDPPAQDPEPLPYLRASEPAAYDIELEVALTPQDGDETVISRTNARGLYWTMAQQLAHASVNGARIRAGDLYATGTISGPDRGSEGSMVELARAGSEPVKLDGGGERTFLSDGDTVTFRGRCGDVTLAEVAGTVLPALDD